MNDGSTDKSILMVNQFMVSNNSNNIRLLNQSNSGVSVARNYGLMEAKGEYIWFVDADDFVEENCLQFILNGINETKAEVFCFKMKRVEANVKFRRHMFSELSQPQYCKAFSFNTSNTCVCRKQTLLLHNILFQTDIFYGEDTLWAFYVQERINNIIYTKEELYNYRNNPTSVMNQRNESAYKKYRESMIKMALSYDKELKNNSALSNNYRYERLCKGQSVQAVLLDLVLHEKDLFEMKRILIKLKKYKLYPYKICWSHLIPVKNIKYTLLNYFTLLFPFEVYYIFSYKFIQKIRMHSIKKQ